MIKQLSLSIFLILILLISSAISLAPESSFWWVNGNPLIIEKIQDCKIIQDIAEKQIQGDCQNIRTFVQYDNKTQTTFENIYYQNYTCAIGTYIDYINTSVCKTIGVQSGNQKILYAENDYNECLISSRIICIKEHQGDYNGKYDSGEGADFFDFGLAKLDSTITKTSQTKEVKIEKI